MESSRCSGRWLAAALLLVAVILPAAIGYRRRERSTARADAAVTVISRQPPRGIGLRYSRPMLAYLVRRLLYALPILIGVNLITFALFFVVNTPDDMARMQLGVKRVTPEAIERWKAERGYDKPLFINAAAPAARVHRYHFLQQVGAHVCRRFRARRGRPRHRPGNRSRMGPSLAIALPTFILGLLVTVSFALLLTFFRASYLDFWGVVLCVAMMSISGLFYIIGGQYLVSKIWKLVPISGYGGGLDAWKFLILPVLIGVVSGIGSSTRWYRTIFLEEISKDYVRTARAKGLSEVTVLFRHVLRNALIPILTGVVVVIPLLFMGSLLTESFFGIPGLGSYTIDAINAQDFAVVRAMVFIGSVLYIVGLILTDFPTLSSTRGFASTDAFLPVILWSDVLIWLLVVGVPSGAAGCRRAIRCARRLAARRPQPGGDGVGDAAAGLRLRRPARFAPLSTAPRKCRGSAGRRQAARQQAAGSLRRRSVVAARRPAERAAHAQREDLFRTAGDACLRQGIDRVARLPTASCVKCASTRA
jgi:peptide/nickel transport system permease protein